MTAGLVLYQGKPVAIFESWEYAHEYLADQRCRWISNFSTHLHFPEDGLTVTFPDGFSLKGESHADTLQVIPVKVWMKP